MISKYLIPYRRGANRDLNMRSKFFLHAARGRGGGGGGETKITNNYPKIQFLQSRVRSTSRIYKSSELLCVNFGRLPVEIWVSPHAVEPIK